MAKTTGFAVIAVAIGALIACAAEQASGPAKQPSTSPATRPAGEPATQLTLDLGNKVTLKLALIPAGKFMMGSPKDEKDRSRDEGPQREVTISKPFYMGVYPVTQEQFQQVMGKNPANFRGPANPVEQLGWGDAAGFCEALSQQTGMTASLPTEAQWEYACRAGGTTRYGFGDDDAKLGDYAWYTENSSDNIKWVGRKSHSVGSKKPNDWGLYDMHGNVCQWCADWYGPYADAKTVDPQGPDSGKERILRGGCWGSAAKGCRCAARGKGDPFNYGNDAYGFRITVCVK
jgi:formylglycine-generating enzyme required for sulfatase activity